jgi:hypothetical protein
VNKLPAVYVGFCAGTAARSMAGENGHDAVALLLLAQVLAPIVVLLAILLWRGLAATLQGEKAA